MSHLVFGFFVLAIGLLVLLGAAGIRAREGGDIENGNAPCGQSAALIRAIVPAGEVVRRLVAETEDVLARLAR